MPDRDEPLFVARPHVCVSFHRRGDWLIGVAHLQGPGAPILLTARANIRDLERAAQMVVMRRAERAAAVGSFFGSIEHAFSKAAHGAEQLAKGKIARELYSQARKVMKSPVASAALAATSVVFPPIGLPASAAFVTANKVLDNVEAGGASAERAKKQIQQLAHLARQPGAAGAKARKVAQVLSITHRWRQNLKDAHSMTVALPQLGGARHRDPADVHGMLELPNGKRAQIHGVERAGRIVATVVLPSGRRVPLRAVVQGGCEC
jgi:hypothetical protein